MKGFRIMGALALAVVFFVAGVAFPSTAEAGPVWSKLGKRKVSYKKDKDTIPVTAKGGLFNGIKIKVSGGAIEMRDIRVTFGNGKTFSPKVRAVFRKKTASRVIDLPGQARIIRKVEFKYRSIGKRGKKATVTLYGRHGKRANTTAVGRAGESPTPAHRQGQIGKAVPPAKFVAGPKPTPVKVHGGIGKKVITVTPTPKPVNVKVKGGIGKKVITVRPTPKPVDVKVKGGIGKKVITVRPTPKPVDLKVKGGIGKKVVTINPGPRPVKVKGGLGKKVVLVTPPAPHGSRSGPTPGAKAGSVASAKAWSRLGSRKASFKGDRDVINVGAAKGTFRALELRVKGSPLEMSSVRVTFGNGATFEPSVRHQFKQGSWTRRIDLPGGKRSIQRVEFRYRSVGVKSGKADVVLYGQH